MNAVVQQKTEGWHGLRKGRVTGSRIGSILGLNPHQTREDVMREMVRDSLQLEREFKGNEATQHGEAKEPFARVWYEKNNNVRVDEVGFIRHPDYEWIGVSPDGLVGFDGSIEIKCPFYTRTPYSVFDPKKKHYLAQCHLVMEVARVQWLDFVCYISDDVVLQERVVYDPKWLPSHLPVLQGFIDEYNRVLADPDLQKQYIKPKAKNEYVEVTDPDLDRLSVLVEQIDLLKAQLDPLTEEFDAIKRRVFDRHSYCHNGKVRVGCVERIGAIDWKRLAADLKVAEETQGKYRKASTFVYSVEKVK